jgi:hypothetical protein
MVSSHSWAGTTLCRLIGCSGVARSSRKKSKGSTGPSRLRCIVSTWSIETILSAYRRSQGSRDRGLRHPRSWRDFQARGKAAWHTVGPLRWRCGPPKVGSARNTDETVFSVERHLAETGAFPRQFARIPADLDPGRYPGRPNRNAAAGDDVAHHA